MVGVNFVRN